MPTFVPTGDGKKKNPFDFGASKDKPAYKNIKGGPDIGLAGTVSDAFRRAAEPASAAAYLIQGKPKEAAGSLADIVRQKEKVRTIGLSDVPVIHQATGKLPWYLRGPSRFAIDVAGDPLTYLTFGASGVARGTGGKVAARLGAREANQLAARRIAASGAARGTPEALPRLNDIARAAMHTGVEKARLDPALQVGLRIPLTREKTIPLAGINLARSKDLLAKLGGRTPGVEALTKSTRKSFLPSRGASKSMAYVHQSVRRAAEVEARAWQKEGQALGRRIYQRARKEGVKPADLNRLIARHIDNPAKYPAPVFAQDLVADTRALFERIGVRELSDGVRRESRENYIPHLLLGDKDVEKLQARYADSVMAKENPFFVKERTAKTFDDLDRVGVRYETNIERLVEARAAASASSRTKLAIDEATYERFGVGAPLAAIPERPAANTAELTAVAQAPYVEGLRGQALEATDAFRRAEAKSVVPQNLADLRAARLAARKQRAIVARNVARGSANATDLVRYDTLIDDLSARIKQAGKVGKRDPKLTVLRAARDQSQKRLVQAGRISRETVEAAAKADAETLTKYEKLIAPIMDRNQALRDLPVARLASNEEWQALTRNWEEVASAPRFKDARIPKPIAKDLLAVHKAIGDSMKHPAAPLRFMRQVQGSWKRLALATPGFHVRNQYEDALRAWWAGARSPVSYAQSASILRGKPGSVKIKGRTLSNDEVYDLARTHGVVDVGFVAQEAASSEARHRLRMEGARHGRLRRANWLRGTEQLGAFREDWNRMALFVERLKAGDNPVEAAIQTRKYLFDYGEVGEFVTTARRYWIPFITYASKAIPLTATQFAKRPGIPAHISMLQSTAMEEGGNPDLSALGPEDQFALPLPLPLAKQLQSLAGARTAKGDEDPIMFLNPKGVMGYTMFSDILDVGSEKGAQRVAGNYLSPFVTKPFEFLTNHRLYTGNQAADRAKANLIAIMMSKTPGADRTGLFGPKKDIYTKQEVPGISSRLDLLLRMFPPYTQAGSLASAIPGQESTNTQPRIGILRTVGGLPVTPYDRARTEYYARKFGGS